MRKLNTFWKSAWLLIGISLLNLYSTPSNAQQATESEAFVHKVNTTYNQNSIPADSILNSLREEAWALEEDSLYVDLTLRLIQKKREKLDIFLITNVLEDLMVKEYEYLKKYPKILLTCYLNLGKFYISRFNPSEASIAISGYYFRRYFEILKTTPLSESENIIHQNHRLNYLEKTQNDSLLYYLDHYNTPKEVKNRALTRWYRSQKDHSKELVYAKKSSDSLALLVAFKNNLKFLEVDTLFPVLLEKFRDKDLYNEHILYLNMGHRYALEQRFKKADKMYKKALNYFENTKKTTQIQECLESIINVKTQSGNVNEFKLYSSKLNTLVQNQHQEELIIMRKYLSFIKDVTDLEIETKKKADKLEKKQVMNDLRYQKTITSIGLAFFLVFSVFIFFYFQSIKEKESLQYKNRQMKVNVLKSKFKPHFTFNILSVINYFIAKKDVENASNAITKMATLLRTTLDNINKDLVPYQSEYAICKDYMYLELLRFSDKFDCTFEKLKDPIMKAWWVPPGIIEPFLENCVNHAFKGRKSKGLITLNHHIENNCLVICVKDNGVGLDTGKLFSEKSHGLNITEEVIQTTSYLYQDPITFEIKTDGGTKINLKIPLLKS